MRLAKLNTFGAEHQSRSESGKSNSINVNSRG